MGHRPSISDLPLEITSHILENLNPWEFIQSQRVCKGFKEIVDHHLSLQSWNWNVTLDCAFGCGIEVLIESPNGSPWYSYCESDTGCNASYSTNDLFSADDWKIQKTFEGNDSREIGFKHFGILAQNPVLRLNKCDFFLDGEGEDLLFKTVFDRIDHKLHIKLLKFFATPLRIIRRVLSHVQPGFLEEIVIYDYPEGEEAEEEAKAIANMDQWRLAKKFNLYGDENFSPLFPTDFLLAGEFFVNLEKVTVDDLVRVKNLFLVPNFEEAYIRHYGDLTSETIIFSIEKINPERS